MSYVLTCLLGILAGGVCVYVLLESKRKRLDEQQRQQEERIEYIAGLNADNAQLEQDKKAFYAKRISYTELQDENLILKRDLANIAVTVQKLTLDRDNQHESQDALRRQTDDLAARYLKDHVKWIGSYLTPSNFANCKRRLEKAISTTAPHNHGSSGTHDRNRSTRMPMFLRVRRVFLVCETRA
jgi:hypothetical protein